MFHLNNINIESLTKLNKAKISGLTNMNSDNKSKTQMNNIQPNEDNSDNNTDFINSIIIDAQDKYTLTDNYIEDRSLQLFILDKIAKKNLTDLVIYIMKDYHNPLCSDGIIYKDFAKAIAKLILSQRSVKIDIFKVASGLVSGDHQNYSDILFQLIEKKYFLIASIMIDQKKPNEIELNSLINLLTCNEGKLLCLNEVEDLIKKLFGLGLDAYQLLEKMVGELSSDDLPNVLLTITIKQIINTNDQQKIQQMACIILNIKSEPKCKKLFKKYILTSKILRNNLSLLNELMELEKKKHFRDKITNLLQKQIDKLEKNQIKKPKNNQPNKCNFRWIAPISFSFIIASIALYCSYDISKANWVSSHETKYIILIVGFTIVGLLLGFLLGKGVNRIIDCLGSNNKENNDSILQPH